MELFSIICTTCQAKLRVRDASAVGQIVTCPKCGSMVLVEAPSAPAEGSETPATAGPVAKPPPRRAPASSPPSSLSSPEATWDISHLADTTDDPTRYGTISPVRQESSAADTDRNSAEWEAPAAIAESEPAESRIAAAPEHDDLYGTSPVSKRRWILAALAGSIGIVLAILLLALIAARQLPTDYPVAEAEGPGKAVSSSSTDSSAKGALEPTTEESKTPSAPNDQQVDSTSAAATTVDKPGADNMLPEKSGSPEGDSSSIPAGDTNQKPEAQAPQSPIELATSEPATAPPDFSAKGSDRANADRIATGGSLAETLRKLGGLFEQPPTEAPENPDMPPEDGKEQPGQQEASKEEDTPQLERPPQREIDIAARLDDPIAEIRLTNTPLLDFIDFMSSLSTIPITLRADDLKWLNLTPTSTVSLGLKDTTIDKTLEAAFSQLGLQHEVINDQILVKRRSLTPGMRTGKLNVSDLTDGDPKRLEELREHVMRLAAPDSWQGVASGSIMTEEGSLVVENTEEVFLEIIALCERLRLARGLPTRSKYDAKHFQLETRTERARPALGRIVKLNFVRQTPFVKILDRMSKELGVHLVVDWRAASEAGWNPEAELSFTASNLTLADALEKLLKPMSLTYRIVDESTFQVTTQIALEEHQELEFYPIGGRLAATTNREMEVNRIIATLPIQWFRESGGTGDVRYDSASQSLLILLSQPKQQAVEKLIGGAAEVAAK